MEEENFVSPTHKNNSLEGRLRQFSMDERLSARRLDDDHFRLSMLLPPPGRCFAHTGVQIVKSYNDETHGADPRVCRFNRSEVAIDLN